eukprot:879397-Lingulodinium_polyedra.AAC.1
MGAKGWRRPEPQRNLSQPGFSRPHGGAGSSQPRLGARQQSTRPGTRETPHTFVNDDKPLVGSKRLQHAIAVRDHAGPGRALHEATSSSVHGLGGARHAALARDWPHAPAAGQQPRAGPEGLQIPGLARPTPEAPKRGPPASPKPAAKQTPASPGPA